MYFDNKIFASKHANGEFEAFPDIERGMSSEKNKIPQLKHMNYLFNRVDNNILDLIKNGINEWDERVIYKKGSLVKSNNIVYVSLEDNNISKLDTINWKTLIEKATLSQYGEVMLTNDYDSNVETKAATPKALKSAVDYAIANSYSVAGSVHVGYIYWGLSLDSTSLLLNGQEVSRTKYADLWKYVDNKGRAVLVSESDWQAEYKKYGFCGKFSVGDNETTFRIPCISYVKGSDDLRDIGKIQEPMLPPTNTVGRHYHGVGQHNGNNQGNFISYPPGINGLDYKPQTINARSAYWNGKNGGELDIGDVSTYITMTTTVNIPDVIGDDSISEIFGKTEDTIELQSVCGFWQIKAIGGYEDISPSSSEELFDQLNVLNGKYIIALKQIEELERKLSKSYVVETYVDPDGKGWYRRWSDGFIMQSGFGTASGWANGATVNLLKPFTTKTYNVVMSKIDFGGSTTVNAYRRDLTNFGAGCEGQGGSSFSSTATMNYIAYGF